MPAASQLTWDDIFPREQEIDELPHKLWYLLAQKYNLQV